MKRSMLVEIYIDAASQGNPGPSGGGILFKGNGIYEEYSLSLGVLSNHEAEFSTFLHALRLCKEKGYKSVSFRTDSQIVSDSVEKQFVKKQEYKKYLEAALQIIQEFDLFFMKWIPSKDNKQADKLARSAIHKI